MRRRKLSAAQQEEVHLCTSALSLATDEYYACERAIERMKSDLSELERRKLAILATVQRASEALERAKRGGVR